MKQRDILALMDGIAPGIAASFVKATAPLLARLGEAEKRVAELEAQRASHLEDLAELKKLVDLEAMRALLPTAEQVAALVNIPKPKELDIDDIVLKVAELVPKPENGKDADPDVIKTQVKDATALWSSEFNISLPKIIGNAVAERIGIEGETVKGAIEQAVKVAVKALPKPKDGDDGVSVLMDDVRPELHKLAADYFAAQPIPKDGQNATPEQIAVEVNKVLSTWPKPKDGKSVDVEAVNKLINDTISSYVAQIPAPKDGVGLAGVLKDHEGCVVFTLTDGTLAKIGKVDGEDGLGFDDLEMIETDTDITFRFLRGDRVKEFRYTKAVIADFYKGVWSTGLHERGALVTWGGSLWMAQRDTEVRPETKDNDDWKLVVKRGRDGKDFTPVK